MMTNVRPPINCKRRKNVIISPRICAKNAFERENSCIISPIESIFPALSGCSLLYANSMPQILNNMLSFVIFETFSQSKPYISTKTYIFQTILPVYHNLLHKNLKNVQYFLFRPAPFG